MATVTARRTADIGRSKNIIGSPREMHQRAPEILLHQRPEDESQDQRRRLASELEQDVAEHGEHRGQHHLGDVRVRAIHADDAEQQDCRIEQTIRQRRAAAPIFRSAAG